MNNSTLTFAEIPAEPYFFLRKKLPEGGLEALLKKNVTPVSNAAHSQSVFMTFGFFTLSMFLLTPGWLPKTE